MTAAFRTPAPEGEACPTCNGVRPEFCSNAFHLASPVVPAPEGEVVAWRYRAKNRPHDNWRLADYDMAADWPNLVAEPLYASPVVPVGVSDQQRAKIELVLVGYRNRITTLDAATDAIIAALRPTETGWREITAEARNGDDVLAYDDETGDCHVSHWTGDYWYGPNGFKPTHWMPLPPAPTDTGRE